MTEPKKYKYTITLSFDEGELDRLRGHILTNFMASKSTDIPFASFEREFTKIVKDHVKQHLAVIVKKTLEELL